MCEPCGPCPNFKTLPKITQRNCAEAYQMGADVGANHEKTAYDAGYEANPFNQGNPEWHSWNLGKETGEMIAAAKAQAGVRGETP